MPFTLDRSLQLEADPSRIDSLNPMEWLTLTDEELQRRLDEEGLKGSASSGWYAPPKGTHAPGSQGGPPATLGAAESLEVEMRLREMERDLLKDYRNIEIGIATSTDGKVILWKEGTSGRIDFTPDEIALMEDAIFTHNHPVSTSFSLEDVAFAVKYNLAEIRCVSISPYTGKAIVYRMTRPPEGWPDIAIAAPLLELFHARAFNDLMEGFAKGTITYQDAERIHAHETMERFSSNWNPDIDYDVEMLQ